jgi:tagatose-1,6-bisphosphate aldolase non-catalytic subunit AgaZ/GatZ
MNDDLKKRLQDVVEAQRLETHKLALQLVNDKYAELKLGPDYVFCAPEARPVIQSDQIKALLWFVLELANQISLTIDNPNPNPSPTVFKKGDFS